MNALTINTPKIQLQDRTMTTTSLNIAEVFQRNHKDVIRKIESLEIPQDFCERNFTPTSKTVAMPRGGEKQIKAYTITRDGFTLLAMGFTGKKAMQFKLAYIEAFNRMETELLNKYEQAAIPNTISPAQQRDIQEKVARYAGNIRANYPKYYGAIKTKFRVGSYTQLPAKDFDAAMRLIDDIAKEQGTHQALPHYKRFLTVYDELGRESTMPIADDAFVMNAQQFLEALTQPGSINVSNEVLSNFVCNASKLMNQRIEYYQMKALAAA